MIQNASAMRLEGKTCLVTGAASGIGLATARAFVREGARVALVDIDAEGVRRAAGELGASGIFADVADERAVGDAFATCDAEVGDLDAVVAGAGIGTEGSLEEVGPERFDRAVAVNLRGSYLTARLAIPRLRARGGGSLVFVSSNAGLIARAHDPVYCATKAAVVMMARSLALGLARDLIRVNAICPGPVDTPTLWRGVALDEREEAETRFLASVPLGRALGRVATAEEVAAAAVYLVSDEASYVTGAALPVDGGKTAGLQVF
jgi:NAD(P)-dependent dehydrogenase (short-subunit alcohol dehydrogenase family)